MPNLLSAVLSSTALSSSSLELWHSKDRKAQKPVPKIHVRSLECCVHFLFLSLSLSRPSAERIHAPCVRPYKQFLSNSHNGIPQEAQRYVSIVAHSWHRVRLQFEEESDQQ